LVIALVATVLTAGCGASGKPAAAPEVGLLATAVTQLEATPGLEQQCEGFMTALSRDLDGDKITDKATLKSRQGQTSECFTTVQTQIQQAAVPLREILKLNGISQDAKYTPEQVREMAGPVAAAYTLLTISSGLDEQVDRATVLVDEARLEVPLGAGPLSEVLEGQEPVETINVLLFLSQTRELLEETVGNAKQLVADSASD
jgi:hypothetical protein